MLSTSAFNALLKTIEEPPYYIVFIFATTELHKVPATIKSRCQQFAFRLIPIETIKGILKNVCDEMKIEAEDEALFWMARESTGSLRDAFTLFDQVASFSSGHIRAESIREKLGLVGLERLNELAESSVEGDLKGGLEILDGLLSSGVAVEQFIIDMAGYYRSLLLLKNSVTRESLLEYPADRFSAKVLEKLDSPRLEQALELILDCYRDIRYSVSPRFEVETLVSKLSWLRNWIPPVELRAAVEGARKVLDGGGRRPASAGGDPSPSARTPSYPPPPRNPPPEAKAAASLSQEFLRRVAARESHSSRPGGGRDSGEADLPDEDAPMWSGQDRGGADPQVQQVLRIFRGTVVSENPERRGR
jgi:DNA polymerase-3 subunit gamma/tau